MMPIRVLIAEDDLLTREALTKAARMKGYDVVSVSNGVDLLSVAADERFDVVITDLMMPDLNGASAAEIMKLQGSTTPVIALTGRSAQDIHLVRDKFTRIFHKPINVGELFEYVVSLVG